MKDEAKTGNTVLLTRDPDELQAIVGELRMYWSECARQRDEANARRIVAQRERDQADRQLSQVREALGRMMSGEDSRAQRLRLKLFQMRDARESASAAGFTLTEAAKAKLYDIQQDIIRAAIDADDSALLGLEGRPRPGSEGDEHGT